MDESKISKLINKIDSLAHDTENNKIIFSIVIYYDIFHDDEEEIKKYIEIKMSSYYDFIWRGDLLKLFPAFNSKNIEFRITPNKEFSEYLGNKIASIKYYPDDIIKKLECGDERIFNVSYMFDYNYVESD